MPLSLFIDALPYNEMKKNYANWFDNMQIAELLPNIAYSSSLHWQLYANKYPDERGVLVDWVKEPEKNKLVCFLSKVLSPLDHFGQLGMLSKKFLDRIVFRKNVFANIPFQFRKDFSEKGSYLFWDENVYKKEPIFNGYTVVSQDEGHLSFEETKFRLDKAIEDGNKNIFGVFGFADSIGHKCQRGELYSQRISGYLTRLQESIRAYKEKYPQEPVLIVSDHGMSTVKASIDLNLEKKFGKQGRNTYIAYSDSAVMCVWANDEKLGCGISEYLRTREEGHLLTEKEREFFKVTDRKFGDIIYILREGYVFENNWFGKSIRKSSADGLGMHGFWPEWEARDSMAAIILIDGKEKLEERYDYISAHDIIQRIM